MEEHIAPLNLHIRSFRIPFEGFLIAAQRIIPTLVLAGQFAQRVPGRGGLGIRFRCQGEVGHGAFPVAQIPADLAEHGVGFRNHRRGGAQEQQLVQLGHGHLKVSLFREELREDEVAGGFPHLETAGPMDAAHALIHFASAQQELAQAVPSPEVAGFHFQSCQELGFGASGVPQFLAG